MAKIEETLRSFSYSFSIIAVVLLFLIFQVYYVHRWRLTALERHHGEAFNNPYAARLQQYTDSGLTNSSVISWGRVGGVVCPTMSEAKAYLEQDESFLGGHEPPRFYDIGDIEAASKIQGKGGYVISKHGVVSGAGDNEFKRTDQYGPLYYKTHDESGNPRWVMRDVYCRSADGLANASCAPWLGRGPPVRDLDGSGFMYAPVMEDGKVVRYEKCPTLAHTVKDGACYLPESMINSGPFSNGGLKELFDDRDLLDQRR